MDCKKRLRPRKRPGLVRRLPGPKHVSHQAVFRLSALGYGSKLQDSSNVSEDESVHMMKSSGEI